MLSFQDHLGDKIPCPQCPPFNYLRSVLIRDCALLFCRFLNMIETPLLLELYAADCICKFQDIQVGPRHGLLAGARWSISSGLLHLASLAEVYVEQVEVCHLKPVLLLQGIDSHLCIAVQRSDAFDVVPSLGLHALYHAFEVFVKRHGCIRQLRDTALIEWQDLLRKVCFLVGVALEHVEIMLLAWVSFDAFEPRHRILNGMSSLVVKIECEPDAETDAISPHRRRSTLR